MTPFPSVPTFVLRRPVHRKKEKGQKKKASSREPDKKTEEMHERNVLFSLIFRSSSWPLGYSRLGPKGNMIKEKMDTKSHLLFSSSGGKKEQFDVVTLVPCFQQICKIWVLIGFGIHLYGHFVKWHERFIIYISLCLIELVLAVWDVWICRELINDIWEGH